MDYSTLLDLATELGYQLAMNGAETFRVEDSITRVLQAYGIESEVFAIPNCLHVSIEPVPGQPITRMKRIGDHGNDLDTVELYSGLSRAICNRKPQPQEALEWLSIVHTKRRSYNTAILLLGSTLAGFGFSFLFGGTFADALGAGACGLLIGIVNKLISGLGANQFFRTMAAAFPMALLAYGLSAAGLCPNPDAVAIGALMLLVPGLLFTNAMRDIIYGDTNSGVNRIVQVLLIAAAIALGTAAAWNVASTLWGTPVSRGLAHYDLIAQWVPCGIACWGFSLLFNIHGKGIVFCVLGGILSWSIHLMVTELTGSDIFGYFWSALFAATYAEVMARIRKYPAISYLVVSIFPMIPGAGVYYSMNYAVQGNMDAFASQGMHTAAIAGVIAVGILLVSTSVRIWTVWKKNRNPK